MKVVNTSGRGASSRKKWRKVIVPGVLLGLAVTSGSAMCEDRMDPEADKILRSMSTYLGGLPAFDVKADVDSEIIDLEGQKLQLSSSAEMLVERPGKLHIMRRGMLADVEMIFDGKTLTIHGKGRNAYFQQERPGSIDDALDGMRMEIDMDMPGADFMYADPYSAFASGVTSSTYLGTVFVNGEECHHLAFRKAKVDWQLWVKAGDEPLPMKYVITTKWVAGAPQYSIRFRDWDTKPKIDADQFKFSAPKGAKKLETITIDTVGEPVMGGDK